jgi:hypothetical protein
MSVDFSDHANLGVALDMPFVERGFLVHRVHFPGH